MVGAWKPIIDQAFGDIVDGYPGRFLERAHIQNAFMGDAATLILEQQREMLPEPSWQYNWR